MSVLKLVHDLGHRVGGQYPGKTPLMLSWGFPSFLGPTGAGGEFQQRVVIVAG